jgi:hypothetical protein
LKIRVSNSKENSACTGGLKKNFGNSKASHVKQLITERKNAM